MERANTTSKVDMCMKGNGVRGKGGVMETTHQKMDLCTKESGKIMFAKAGATFWIRMEIRMTGTGIIICVMVMESCEVTQDLFMMVIGSEMFQMGEARQFTL